MKLLRDLLRHLLRHLVLPREVSAFEAAYLRRLNRIAIGLFWIHPPLFAAVALLAGTSPAVAAGLAAAAALGPTLAHHALPDRPRAVDLICGVAAMLMGGVLVYVGRGPMQIEMHFYFFVLIALLAVFGNPLVIVAAAATVMAHHGVLYALLPRAVFDYDASIGTVAVHATFVAIEAVGACLVARSFFDRVISLERIVASRTQALNARNRDMTLILDNVAQGFATVGLDGSIGAERSRALTRWFGEPAPGARWWSYLADTPERAAWLELAFGELSGELPLEIALEQLPRRIERGGRHYTLEHQPIGAPIAEPPTALLVVVTDVTDKIARRRAESGQRELIAVVERALVDHAGFTAFAAEAEALLERCAATGPGAFADHQRSLHTLKGTAALFGASSIAGLCHELEGELAEQRAPLAPAQRGRLVAAWATLRRRIDPVLGLGKRPTVVIDRDEYQRVIASLAPPEPPWAAAIRRWGLDPTRPHLERLAEHARGLAAQLGKGELAVEIADGDVRTDAEQLQPIWSALVHVVRNSVDHGVEPPDRRRAAGKPPGGRLRLATRLEQGRIVIEVTDDGAGIDWARVQARAQAIGLAAATPGELEEALFALGLSTAEEATELSGRGVGLDALRTACRRLGGRVEISSALGLGATVRCTLPVATADATARTAA